MQISSDLGGIPQKAIDGSTSSFFNVDTCTLTRPERVPWWYVNLLEPYMVQLVRLDFGRNLPATIVVRVGNNRPDLGTNPICNRFTGQLEEGKPLFLPCNPPMPGAFVSVHLEGASLSQLSICEAFVYTDQTLKTATIGSGWVVKMSQCPSGIFQGEMKIVPVTMGPKAGYGQTPTAMPKLTSYVNIVKPKACGKPEQPPNSTMVAKNFNVGAVIDYTCDEGHLLVGPASRTCLPTGFYNEFPPVCKPEIPNGHYQLINGTVGYLSRVIYTCDEGYELIGRAQLMCDIDERWNGPPPRCEAIECEDPPEIVNGRFVVSNNLTIAGTTVEYVCNSQKFKLVGPKKIVCLPSGEYDEEPPVCRAGVPVPGGKPSQPQSTSTKPRVPSPGPTRPGLPPARPGPQTPHERPTKDKSPNRNKPGAGDNNAADTAHVPHVIAASHPQDNEIPDSVNVRSDQAPNVNVAHSVDEERRETGARLNLGAIIALGVFGGFVFLAAVITTIVILIRRISIPSLAVLVGRNASFPRHEPCRHDGILSSPCRSQINKWGGANSLAVLPIETAPQPAISQIHSRLIKTLGPADYINRAEFCIDFLNKLEDDNDNFAARNRSTKHYRHRASPDCNTVASFDSSGSESRGGLNRYYRQAWENLHHESVTAGNKPKSSNHSPLRRKETLDEPVGGGYRNVGGTERDGSELVVNDTTAAVYPPKPSAVAAAEKKRHHHHHHHHATGATPKESGAGDWRQQGRKSRY
ncbi:hypothetical protein C0J52_14785 [Blattella germanica]|nr:hypothetical protein C0J52_14785 [Blattella germanica]